MALPVSSSKPVCTVRASGSPVRRARATFEADGDGSYVSFLEGYARALVEQVLVLARENLS